VHRLLPSDDMGICEITKNVQSLQMISFPRHLLIYRKLSESANCNAEWFDDEVELNIGVMSFDRPLDPPLAVMRRSGMPGRLKVGA